jgi:hypothetical protein
MRLAILSLCLALAGCATEKSAHLPLLASAMATPGDRPQTRAEASLSCWMKFENGRQTLNIDQRAALVDKCVKARMRGTR